MKIKSFYGFGRVTLKFYPSEGTEWVVNAKQIDLGTRLQEVRKTMVEHKYAAFIKMCSSEGDIIIDESIEVSKERGRELWDLFRYELGFTPTAETTKKMRKS